MNTFITFLPSFDLHHGLLRILEFYNSFYQSVICISYIKIGFLNLGQNLIEIYLGGFEFIIHINCFFFKSFYSCNFDP